MTYKSGVRIAQIHRRIGQVRRACVAVTCLIMEITWIGFPAAQARETQPDRPDAPRVSEQNTSEVTRAGLIAKPGALYVLSTVGSRLIVVDPTTGSVLGVERTGYRPDIAIAPDGGRIYINSTDFQSGMPLFEIIDTSTGSAIGRFENPDSLGWEAEFPRSFMSVSPDGQWVYMLKRHSTPEGDIFYVAAFDVRAQRFAPSVRIDSHCSTATLFGRSSGLVDVVCGSANVVYVVQFSPTSTNSSTKLHTLPISIKKPRAHIGEITDLDSVITAVADRNTSEIIGLKTDGRAVVIDSEKGELHATEPLLDGQWIPSSAVADDNRIYIPVSPLATRNGTAESILVIDRHTFSTIGAFKPSEVFTNLAIAPDAHELYLLAPTSKKVVVIDTNTLQQSMSIDLGVKPSFALVVPGRQTSVTAK